eukprot:scaffold11945_cov60-Cylindrotheca_fusiformis.AAC.2
MEKDFLATMQVDPASYIHFFHQHGLSKQEARRELKLFSIELPSSRGLEGFEKKYPAIFETLESCLGRFATSTATVKRGMIWRMMLMLGKLWFEGVALEDRKEYSEAGMPS